jgi:hypothetical protein
MSRFKGLTASSKARIKEGKESEAEKLLDKYDFGRLKCMIYDGSIQIWGKRWPNIELKDKTDIYYPDTVIFFDEFLKELSPLLAEDLIIQAVGNCGCSSFPIGAVEIRVTPQDVILETMFKWMEY